MNRAAFICLALLGPGLPIIHAANHFAATDGNDANPGTSRNAPFRTIQHAVRQLQAGDVLHVRGGRYHEVVRLHQLRGTATAPITIRNFPGERVVIAGTIPIQAAWSPWEKNPNVYRARIGKPIWQLFVDGRSMVPAQWPNITKNWDEPDDSFGQRPTPGSYWDKEGSWARLATGSVWGSFRNDDSHHNLSSAGVSFEGAVITMLQCLVNRNHITDEVITSHAAGSNRFTHTTRIYPANTRPKSEPERGRFLIVGDLDCLDSPGEWFYEKRTGDVYVWPRDGPMPVANQVEGRIEGRILTMEGCQFINFVGIEFFSGSFLLKETYDTSFDECRFLYSSCKRRMLGEELAEPEGNATLGRRPAANLAWSNCEFAYSEGVSLSLRTHGNRVENNWFHNCSWGTSGQGVVSDKKGSHTVYRRNTFHTIGSGNATKNGPNALIEWNHSYNFMFPSDSSGHQIPSGTQKNTICRYNWVRRAAHRNGFRFDGDPAGIKGTIYRCVATGCSRGFRLKGDYHRICNLTALGNSPKSDVNIAHHKFYGLARDGGIVRGRRGNLPNHGNENSLVRNVAGQIIDVWPLVASDSKGIYHGHARKRELASELRDPENLDFRPRQGSALIDKGVAVEGVTDGFVGQAPDVGAYEYGAANYWIPGCTFRRASTPIPPDRAAAVRADADLMWLAGRDARAHRVYFGMGPGRLVLVGEQANNICSPGKLEVGRRYFWRVDTVTEKEAVPGRIWSFTVGQKRQRRPVVKVFRATEDASVFRADPDRNDGSARELTLAGGDVVSLLKFEVTGVGPAITHAVLRLQAERLRKIRIHQVPDTGWSQGSVTWNTRPKLGLIVAAGTFRKGQAGEFNISPLIEGNGTYTVAIASDLAKRRTFWSSESDKAPELVVSFTEQGNRHPSFSAVTLGAPAARAGKPYHASIAGEARDLDGDPLRFRVIGQPQWLAISPDGTLTGAPGRQHVGKTTFTVRVEDSHGAGDEALFDLTVDP